MHIFILFLISSIFSNEIIINSKVTNIENQPLEKANISCGESYATTNAKGNFSIKCNQSEILKISYIGYKDILLELHDISNLIILVDEDINFDDVIISGGLNPSLNDSRIKVINKSKFNLNGKENFIDILQSNPELNFAGGTSNPRYLQIRGLGELSQFSGEGAPHFYIGVFIDDINFTGLGGISLLDDIKQIEIFKGPQSTAFGSNAMAGAINMISSSPKFDRVFNVKFSHGSFNTNRYSVNLIQPITKKISSNVSIIKNDTDGYIKNSFLSDQNSNSKDEILTKIKLLYIPNKNSKYLFTSYYINMDNNYDAWTVNNNGYNTQSDYQGIDKQETQAFSLKSLFNIKQLEISSIISYSDNDIDYSYDGDWGNENMWALEPYNWNTENNLAFSLEACYEDDYYHEPTNTECFYSWSFPDITKRNRKLLSQDLRLSLKDFLFGFHTSNLKEEDQRNGYFFSGNWDDMNSTFKIENISLYTKYDYSLSKQSKINISVRYDSYKTINDLYYRSSYSPGAYEYQKHTINDYNIGWNILFNKSLSNYSNIIFTISKGYKTSGINQSPNFASTPNYESEESINTEFGYTISKNKISLKSSIFYMDRNRPQLRLFIQNNINYPTYFDYATFNGSSSYTYGFESNLSYELSERLIFYGAINFLENYLGIFYFDENGDGTVEKFGDRTGSHSPKLSLSYGTQINFTSNLSLNLDSNYKNEFYFDEQNNHKANPYTLINSSLIYNKDNISISFWGKNLTNEKYAIRGYSFVLDPYTSSEYTQNKSDYKSYGEKKSLGITLQYSF